MKIARAHGEPPDGVRTPEERGWPRRGAGWAGTRSDVLHAVAAGRHTRATIAAYACRSAASCAPPLTDLCTRGLLVHTGAVGMTGTYTLATVEVRRRERARLIPNDQRLSPAELHMRDVIDAAPPLPGLPKTRGECREGVRPCPFASCRHHLAVNVTAAGALHTSRPRVAAPDTCALDVAERGGVTLESVSELLGVTRERIRQIEANALRKLQRIAAMRRALDEWPDVCAEQTWPEALV